MNIRTNPDVIVREAKAGQLDALKAKLKLKAVDQPVLLRGHCHQKTFAAVTPVMKGLQLIPGAKPELIESSCCGMAGSFGYETEHYDVSMQMAEASLLPAVRAKPDAIVVADGAQREAVHVARLLVKQILGD